MYDGFRLIVIGLICGIGNIFAERYFPFFIVYFKIECRIALQILEYFLFECQFPESIEEIRIGVDLQYAIRIGLEIVVPVE